MCEIYTGKVMGSCKNLTIKHPSNQTEKIPKNINEAFTVSEKLKGENEKCVQKNEELKVR